MAANDFEQFRQALAGPLSDARAPLTPRITYWSWLRAALAFQPVRPPLSDSLRFGSDLVDADLAGAPSARPSAPAPLSGPAVKPWRKGWTRLRHSGVAAAVSAALGVVSAIGSTGGYALYLHAQQRHDGFLQKHCGTSNPALETRAGGECTGVTDGSDGPGVFGTALEPLLAAMRAENSEATRGGRYVTVAFLAPLSSRDTAKGEALDRFVAEAEGAYTAVEQANADSSSLKIRLVLAGMGSGERYWKDAVDQLKSVRNLAAVTGMGLARAESVDAARELDEAGIPMVADLFTADGFDTTGAIEGKGSIKGLIRVGFTNTALLTAVGKELAGQKHTAAVVRSVAPKGSPDLYTESLYRDFISLNGFKKHLLPAAGFTFDPSSPNSSLDVIGRELCDINPPIDTVYFAAREKYLPDFLTALGRRPCRQQQITVVTGAGTADLDLATAAPQRLDASITVLYPSFPTPTALQSDSNRDRALYNAFLQAFTRDHHGQAFVAAHATRGHSAVFAHDAVLTAATAIRDAATSTATALPSRYAVRDRLYALTDDAVPGASGRFGIDATGNRTTAPVTVNRLGGAP
ncbi:ABC transporter substrate-binding protein [Streptomyces sp. NPDC051677]|uniref:ABC transporter substrate-binding protein n=1 Tax=Streptomyces sp. NPDC051677 TaxID=3365669 RepID=UPI0037CF58B3